METVETMAKENAHFHSIQPSALARSEPGLNGLTGCRHPPVTPLASVA